MLVAVLIYGQQTSTHFFTTTNIFFIGVNVGEIAIMALPLTLIVVVGEIDLSVASMLGLSSALMGLLYEHGWPIPLAILVVLLVGLAGGAFNGWLVTVLGLPSIAVTIGTLALFRGLAEITLKDKPVSWSTAGLPVDRHQADRRHPDGLGDGHLLCHGGRSTPSCCTPPPRVARCTRSGSSRRQPASRASE